MGFRSDAAALIRVMRRGPTMPAPYKIAMRHKPTLLGMTAMERWVSVSGSVDQRIKSIAALRASSLIGCMW